ncbi:hypothetical protein [Streptosporangium jomthongense]|uniref:Uncharacterized protein n=1 Tax=Streptosporangium jomthongense TaxID=1193683 RepID=A0ABV8F0K4_9ACTN
MSDIDTSHKYGYPPLRTGMPIGRRDTAPVGVPQPEPVAAPTAPFPAYTDEDQAAAADRPPESQPATPAGPPPPPPTAVNPLLQWWQASRDDSAQRKDRGQGWWLMRWMGEQPTSVADHLDYYLHQRDERPDGRCGWGLRTGSPLINGAHAAGYRAYGLSVGLAVTLAAYALGWMAQRPGRFLLLSIGALIVITNLNAWLAGP